ncbi:kinase-like domain-containing protein [Xylaria telfairii]|nr:kinase-like domain-containing protein [Xylaria telfairii]
MVPRITSWEDLLWVSEEVNEDTGDFQYTMFATVEDDMIFYGQLNKPKADILFQDATDSLARIPDDEIFPRWPQSLALTKAPEELPPDGFVKRPRLALYDVFLEHKVVHLLPKGLVEEAEAMESGHIIQEKKLFIESLESAIHHLHSLGWAHNDLNPTNVLVAEDQKPILIGFGSARRLGEKLSTSRGTKGWIDCEMKDYTTSETRHDTSALAKLRAWLDNPTFEG